MLLDKLVKALGALGPVAIAAGDKLGDVISDIIDDVCGDGKDGGNNLPTKDVKK